MSDTQDVVRTKRIELIDDDGHTRVTLDAGNREDDTGLTLFGPEGKAHARLAWSAKEGVRLHLFDATEQLRIALALPEDGVAHLTLYNTRGHQIYKAPPPSSRPLSV